MNGNVTYCLLNCKKQQQGSSLIGFGDQRDVDNGPQFILQSDGKIILNKELVQPEAQVTQSPNQMAMNKLRQRRSDHIIVQAQDQGDKPLSTIISFQINYFDPLINDPSSRSNGYGQPFKDSRYNTFRSDDPDAPDRSSSLFGPRSVPILYGLAICVFFIFITVIITLISLYFRNRRYLATQNKSNCFVCVRGGW
ncbi:hypothetical protein Ciccas_014188 [Cichlidogyrus casuarinus]|uniref:Uncharacterized protein n=1 Tax=Cichlidogyrus casuarinus TaxID=1844966 RepID=A0ABD2PKX7_9PLAT